MVTGVGARFDIAGERRFFFYLALAMTVTIIAGFSLQLAMGRSTFDAPWLVHVHGVTFFGWTFFYLLQNSLVFTGNVSIHRRVGWIGVGWVVAMVVLGVAATAMMVREGRAPPFFTPLYFLTMNSLEIFGFAGMFAVAIGMRRHSDWHRRLMACAMAGITEPAFGRLLPGPLLIPWAAVALFSAALVFPLAGLIHDRRSAARVHPAWWWGIGALVANQLLIELVSTTAIALSAYGALADGAAGARFAPLAYPPLP